MKTKSESTSVLAALFAAAALTFATTPQLAADVPPIIHHQGVLVGPGGVLPTDSFKFVFALVDATGTTSYWSNDGTSVAGSMPTSSVLVPVSEGVFNVALGDTAAGMDPIPKSVFENEEVYLRIWVGGDLLTPDQRVTSVGYAMIAGGLTPGAITPASIPPNTINTSHIVNGSIVSADLSDNGVTSDDIADDLVLESLNLENGGALRTELSSNAGGRVRLWDSADTITAFLGSTGGGGDLNLFQIDSEIGIRLDGDTSNYNSGASAGGEITVHGRGGFTGLRLDGDQSGAGRIEVKRSAGAWTTVDVRGLGRNLGGEVWVNSPTGGNGVEIVGAGDPTNPEDPDVTGGTGGQITLYQPGGDIGAILYGNADVGGGALSLRDHNGNSKFRLYGGPHDARMEMADAEGVKTIELDSSFGQFPEARLVMRQNETNAGAVSTIDMRAGNNDIGGGGGRIQLRNASGQLTVELDAFDSNGDGIVRTQVLEITGGSDLSEQFDIRLDRIAPEPGMLVSIDLEQPGQLVPSSSAYDRTAAGVISGAGGVKTGMVMGQRGSIADGEHPVALTGRVYACVDAGYGAVEPGDLITTSDTPGHGMKVSDHSLAQGAIVGKAMTSLESGRGLVLILVSLQ